MPGARPSVRRHGKVQGYMGERRQGLCPLMATGSLVGHTPSAAMLGAERERRQVVGDYYMEERHLYGVPAVSW